MLTSLSYQHIADVAKWEALNWLIKKLLLLALADVIAGFSDLSDGFYS